MSNFFQNKECEYFPCHKTENNEVEKFNCKMCYCPLYYADCGGDFCLTKSGIKDCSNCSLPHLNYEQILKRIEKLNNIFL